MCFRRLLTAGGFLAEVRHKTAGSHYDTTATIRPDGMIALPLVKEVKAAGRTAPQLEAELTGLYRKYLKAPSISVAVRQFQMNHIYVMGEVAKPGRYGLTDNMTVLDALTLAGGTIATTTVPCF